MHAKVRRKVESRKWKVKSFEIMHGKSAFFHFLCARTCIYENLFVTLHANFVKYIKNR